MNQASVERVQGLRSHGVMARSHVSQFSLILCVANHRAPTGTFEVSEAELNPTFAQEFQRIVRPDNTVQTHPQTRLASSQSGEQSGPTWLHATVGELVEKKIPHNHKIDGFSQRSTP